MAKKNTEVPTKKPSTKALAVAPKPSALARTGGGSVKVRGLENVERNEVLLPRIVLLQPLSPQVTGELNQKPGTIFLNLSNKTFGTKVQITPILHFRSRIYWTPREEGGGIDCSSLDGKTPTTDKYAKACADCSHSQWDNTAEKRKDQAPACTLYDNFLVLIGDSTEPVVVPMERTKAKTARKLYSMAALKGGDLWDATYELSVVKEKNPDDQAYFNYSIADIGKATPDAKRKVCEKLWETLRTQQIQAGAEHPEEGTDGAKATGIEAGEKY